MRKTICLYLNLIAIQSFLNVFVTNGTVVVEKADAAIPVATLSPPEGNTTFLGGTSWCVARAGSSTVDLQVALDWACGQGRADCSPIQPGGPCFEPNNLLSHASFAFNAYYQQNGNSDIACYFGGTAALTPDNPSRGRCVFAMSETGTIRSSSAHSLKHDAESTWWRKLVNVIILLLYFGR